MPDSTRPIRALIRGLQALAVLNRRNGATVSEVAGEVKLPRTTTYRILETLCEAGYAFRDPADERYRLTPQVRGLSEGFRDEPWVVQLARPMLEALGRDLAWPVALATPAGASMAVRASTAPRGPTGAERYGDGQQLPLLASAAGRAYLAHCAATERDEMLGALAAAGGEDGRIARDRTAVQKMLEETRSRGYALFTRPRNGSDEVSLAAPVLAGRRAVAALTLRHAAGAVTMKAAQERFVPRLRDAARRIGERLGSAESGHTQN